MNSEKNATTFEKNSNHRGSNVEVKVFGGGIVDRIVWDEDRDVIYLCTKRCFEALLRNDDSTRPVGFPKIDIVRWL